MKHYKIIASALLLTTILVGCKPQQNYRRIEATVWNTVYSIIYDSPENLDSEIVETMNRVESSLSPFKEGSLISRINRCETDSVDSMIATIFHKSQEINALSAGAFDPTVAPLINVWGFGYEKSDAEPTQAVIDSCLRIVGIADCCIVDGSMVKKSPATHFNFSAITKGFGCDEVGRTLQAAGCSNYMVEIGGEIALKGKSSRGGKWRVMVDAPVDTTAYYHERLTVIEATDCGIATSGNYRNFRDGASGRYGHTISPLTGRPVVSEVLSVTVIAPDTMTADALATACMAMPLSDAKAMIESLEDCSALFVTAAPDGSWLTTTTSRFPPLL